MDRFHPRKSTLVLLALLVLAGLLNLAAWCSPAFADWYVDILFPIVTAPLSHLTSLLPFSLGEWLLPAAVIWLAVFLLVLLVWAVLAFLSRPGFYNSFRSSHRRAGFARRFTRATCWMLTLVLLIMTLNCFILYHVTPLEESLPGYGKEYTIEELGELRDYIVKQCNTLAEQMPRDEDNEVVYEGGFSAMAETARSAIANLASLSVPVSVSISGSNAAGQAEDGSMDDHDAKAADTEDSSADSSDDSSRLAGDSVEGNVIFSRLSGWTTTAKPLFFSDFVSQQYIQGYYYPFTMEANINTIMKTTNQPATMCHELSHTHGYIYEDEANLIGFLACICSEDPFFQYSGWLSVLNYVNNSYYNNVDAAEYRSHITISDLVKWDNQFLSEEAWEEVESDAVLSTETVKSATDTYLDTTLKVNGVESGKASYSHVVELLLMYFDGNW